MTAKTRAIPSLYRDNFPGLPGQVLSRILRRVTFTTTTAVPLAAKFLGSTSFKNKGTILTNN
jgi:hypothetical protein